MLRPTHNRNNKLHSISISHTSSHTSSRHSLSNPKLALMHRGTSPMRKHLRRCAPLYIHLRQMILLCHSRYQYHCQHRQWDTHLSIRARNRCSMRSFRSFRPNPNRLTRRRLTRRTLNLQSLPSRLSIHRKRNISRPSLRYHSHNLMNRDPKLIHNKADTRGR